MTRATKHIMVVALLWICGTMQSFAEPLEAILFIKIAAPEQKAVIKTSDGQLRMVGVGDGVGDDYKIVEIVKDRVVLEKGTGDDKATVIVTLRNGKQSLQRITKKPEKQQPLYKVQ